MKTKVLVSIAVGAFLLHCGSIVHKERANKTKKLAVIWVDANAAPYNKKGGGGLSSLTALAGKASGEKRIDFGGNRLVTRALEKTVEQLRQVDSWQVLDPKETISSAAYKEFMAQIQPILKEAGSLSEIASFFGAYPEGYPEQPYKNFKNNEKVQAAIRKLANDLGVDAVVMIDVDVAYEAWLSVGDSGLARPYVSIAIQAQDKDGNWVIRMLSAKDTGLFSGYSEEKTALVAGNIPFGEKTEKLYYEAIDAAAKKIAKKLNEEMR